MSAIEKGDLVVVTRQCCAAGEGIGLGLIFCVDTITLAGQQGFCESCRRIFEGPFARAAEWPAGKHIMLSRLTRIDPLAEPEQQPTAVPEVA